MRTKSLGNLAALVTTSFGMTSPSTSVVKLSVD